MRKILNIGIFISVLIILLIGAWYFIEFLVDSIANKNYITLYKLIGLLLLVVVSVSYFFLFLNKTWKADKEELKDIQTERKEIQGEMKGKDHTNVIDSIRLSLNRLQEYYTINTNQAKRSFTFSLLAIVMGLMVLITGILFFYVGSQNVTLTAISSISGVLIQFIGGAYFLMYKKSLGQLNYFYQQLIMNQNTMLAINLTDSIEDPNKATEMKQRIIEALLKRDIDDARKPNSELI